MLDTSIIQNNVVRAAVEAWQNVKLEEWFSYFVDEPVLLENNLHRDFKEFSGQICCSYFISLDVIIMDGRTICGNFYSEDDGSYFTYFKFWINDEQKIERLEMDQKDHSCFDCLTSRFEERN